MSKRKGRQKMKPERMPSVRASISFLPDSYEILNTRWKRTLSWLGSCDMQSATMHRRTMKSIEAETRLKMLELTENQR